MPEGFGPGATSTPPSPSDPWFVRPVRGPPPVDVRRAPVATGTAPHIAASPNVQSFVDTFDTPGVRYIAFPYTADPSSLIAQYGLQAGCDSIGVQPYEDGGFVGVVQVGTGCGTAGAATWMFTPRGAAWREQILATLGGSREPDAQRVQAVSQSLSAATPEELERAEKNGVSSLDAASLARLPTLYRATLSGLSVARAISLDANLLSYLEVLSARAYLSLYGVRERPGALLAAFFAWRLPAAVRGLTTLPPHEALRRLGGDLDDLVRFLASCRSDRGFFTDLRPPVDVMIDVVQPTLVLATRNDAAVGFDHPERLAGGLRRGRLREIDSPSHLLWLGDGWRRVQLAMTSFLG